MDKIILYLGTYGNSQRPVLWQHTEHDGKLSHHAVHIEMDNATIFNFVKYIQKRLDYEYEVMWLKGSEEFEEYKRQLKQEA
jgi:hypothetical protein